jgi:hypothetical protein
VVKFEKNQNDIQEKIKCLAPVRSELSRLVSKNVTIKISLTEQ